MSDRLPLSQVTLAFGILSIPLAFIGHLCVPATIMGALAIAFHFWGRRKRKGAGYSQKSIKWSALGYKLALAGTFCGITMWVLWGTNVLLQ
jgi:hypothetical protein